MRFVEFEESNNISTFETEQELTMEQESELIDDNIPIYPIPSYITELGNIVVCGQLDFEELEQIKKTGKIYIQLPVFNEIVMMPKDTVLKPDMPYYDEPSDEDE